jgi:hypothetical protein
VRTVALGGFNSSAGMTFRSFPGLQVVDSGYLYSVLDALLQNTTDQTDTASLAPRQLLTSAAFRMCIREIYKSSSSFDTPLEYDQQDADYHWLFSREEALDPQLLWTNIQNKLLR